MQPEIVWAVSLRKPLPHWGFRSGNARPVNEIDAPIRKLLLLYYADRSEANLRACMSALCPEATDDDWESMTAEDWQNFLKHVQQKETAVETLIEERQKNELGGIRANENGIPPSSPTTTSTIASPESPGPSAEIGSSSGVSRTGKRSSPSTRSKKSSGSTTSSPTLTP